MSHKVFISYSLEDRDTAGLICAHLENEKIRCWIAPRDVIYRENYDESVTKAINQSFILLLILSKNSNMSLQILKEVKTAFREDKLVVLLCIDGVPISDNINEFIGTIPWFDAANSPLEKYIEELLSIVKNMLIYLEKYKFTIFYR